MVKPSPDEIDIWCTAWARQRRIALGIIEGKMIEPKERIGQLRCTLGKVRTEKEGASHHRVNQHFPEVYLGMALMVHRCIQIMMHEQRLILHLQYVWREIPVKEKMGEIPTSMAGYWLILNGAKSFIRGYAGAQKAIAGLTPIRIGV